MFISKGRIFTQRLSVHKFCDINCMESVVLKAFSNGDLCNIFIAQEGFPHSLTDGVEGRFITRCQNGLSSVCKQRHLVVSWWWPLKTFFKSADAIPFFMNCSPNPCSHSIPPSITVRRTGTLLVLNISCSLANLEHVYI